MNIFVTGAAGFIGSHVCEQLINLGHFIIGIDNFDNFYPKRCKQSNLEVLEKSEKFKFYEIDIRDRSSLDLIFTSYKIDIVIHLAAKAGVRPSLDFIEEYYSVNINGTVCLLELMKSHNVNKLLFASSSSVYGNSIIVPFSEANQTANPVSPYASTKKSCELLCHVYYHLYGFDITCLRFFTVYGPRQRPDLAIYKFTKLIDEGNPIPFYGDGSAARDYTFIGDIVNGIICALNYLKGYNIYNLGESKVIDLNLMVRTIEEALGKKAILNKLPDQPGDVKITYADISKAKSEIGYNPVVSFRDGINLFIQWYLKNTRIHYSNIQ
ncbi:MAG TPA: SDR family NAD(P)-dependent oxidoreductase [Bacteroidales bacterium]